MIRFARTSGPASEPVTLAEFKAHARIEHTAEDAILGSLLSAARVYIETQSGRAIGAQVWTATLDAWPLPGFDGRRRIRLAPTPSSIVSVAVDGIALGASLYALAGDELVVDTLAADPATGSLASAIVVTFNAGDTQPALLHAIKLLAAHYYENREATNPAWQIPTGVPYGVASLIAPFQVLRL